MVGAAGAAFAPLITKFELLARTFDRAPDRVVSGAVKLKVRVSMLKLIDATIGFADDPDAATGKDKLSVPVLPDDTESLDEFPPVLSEKFKVPGGALKTPSGNLAVAVRVLDVPPVVPAGGVTEIVMGTTAPLVLVPKKDGGGAFDGVVLDDDAAAGTTALDALEDDPVPAALVAVTVKV